MKVIGDDNARPVTARRVQVSSRPVRVALPGLTAALFVLATVAVTVLAGLPAELVVTATVVVALLVALFARHTVGALAAGAGMRVARPYCPGERVQLRVPSLDDEVVEAEIVRVGPANTTLMTSGGLVVVPNNRMLRTG